MNVQGCLAFTRTFRVEILSINKKITRWDDSLPSGRCRPSDKGGRGGGAVIQTLRCGGGGGAGEKKKNFPALRASGPQLGLTIRGGGGPGSPGPSPESATVL